MSFSRHGCAHAPTVCLSGHTADANKYLRDPGRSLEKTTLFMRCVRGYVRGDRNVSPLYTPSRGSVWAVATNGDGPGNHYPGTPVGPICVTKSTTAVAGDTASSVCPRRRSRAPGRGGSVWAAAGNGEAVDVCDRKTIFRRRSPSNHFYRSLDRLQRPLADSRAGSKVGRAIPKLDSQ